MNVAVDLHIHSALSPCAENDMTPNNIINMAYIKGLEIIAVTDHNSVENLPAVMECAKERGIIAVPGMEVETREEVHLICLLPDLDAAFQFQNVVYQALPDRVNREDIFGQQLVMNACDEVVSVNKRFLITAADLGIDEVICRVKALNGVALPAHVDREAYSIISNLGFIPDSYGLTWLEISRTCRTEELITAKPWLKKFQLIKSSDAHQLGNILEKGSFLKVKEKSIRGLLDTLSGKLE